jgi:transposase-like protein
MCGVSTRRVDQRVESLRRRISTSEVAGSAEPWTSTSTSSARDHWRAAYPYLFLDAKVETVPAGGCVVNKAL